MHVDAVPALDGGRRGQVATAAGRDDRPDGAQGPTGQAGHAGDRRPALPKRHFRSLANGGLL